MKFRFIAILLAFGGLAEAQTEDKIIFDFIQNGFDVNWHPNSLLLSGDVFIASNAVNTNMFSDVVFRSGFTKDSELKFRDLNRKNTNVFVSEKSSLEYKLNNKSGIFLGQDFMIGYTSSKSLSELLVFGNSSFLGEEIISKNMDLLLMNKISAGYTYNHINTDRLRIKGSYGFNFLIKTAQIEAAGVGLFTSTQSDSIRASISNTSILRGSNGVGLNLGLDLEYTLNEKNQVGLNIGGLNLNYLFKSRYNELDTTFIFSGVNVRKVEGSFRVENNVFSELENIDSSSSRNKSLIILPSQVSVYLINKLNKDNSVTLRLETIGLGSFGVTGMVGWDCFVSKKIAIRSSLGYGTFSGPQWMEKVEMRLLNKINVCVGLMNLHSLIIPQRTTSYGATIGISKQF